MEFDDKRTNVEKQVLEYLTKRKFKEASLIVAAYEAKQSRPRGIGIDWKHYNTNRDIAMLSIIFRSKPKILVQLKNEKFEALRIAAAMMALLGENRAKKWLPYDFKTDLPFDNDTAARMLFFHAQNQVALEEYLKSRVIKRVEVLATQDSCEACKKLTKKRYELNEAPELPSEHCIHKLGCRCVYLPCVD